MCASGRIRRDTRPPRAPGPGWTQLNIYLGLSLIKPEPTHSGTPPSKVEGFIAIDQLPRERDCDSPSKEIKGQAVRLLSAKVAHINVKYDYPNRPPNSGMRRRWGHMRSVQTRRPARLRYSYLVSTRGQHFRRSVIVSCHRDKTLTAAHTPSAVTFYGFGLA
ncbi:hypothetical protein EVAR_47814_1 [Eumeta japonica]|uniref:Uncharacterized protein n=1 Tax=Eumeta variegata TaxID=151549 RepID=A0A4C1YZT5_EUMVA|nr:hypothetical protein EVAR_47814_1 [Eumeta japonica]